MMKMLDMTPTMYEPAAAVALAAEMTANDEDGWVYTATNPDGSLGPYSQIIIVDEDGLEVGRM